MMADRRRINGPAGTAPPSYAINTSDLEKLRPSRNRRPEELRKIFLKTGVTPPASGSAYLELQSPTYDLPVKSVLPPASALKISCAVHGPKPLPRSAPYNPQLVLSTHVKFAPFATRHRRGYIRDSTERDLGAHLENALRGIVIGKRWPKSGVDVIITILEGEEDRWWGDEVSGGTTGLGVVGGWGMMNVLAGCITVASAALVDAGIDCVDLVCGGVAAILPSPDSKDNQTQQSITVLDPSPPEHPEIQAACVVGYSASRDEITELWLKGDSGAATEQLIDSAVAAAVATRAVMVEAMSETALSKFPEADIKSAFPSADAVMSG
ncbi:hypothetical protein EJ06DRAFT_499774 [Trichodelitschia bisporula]|uniref:Exoribonuclease phosphorolytic domain-containing protein n=1 Tax=Trichodelitschia bisporula TaxID=703511 RepID=A0A6G1HKN2_9PEZI|nr:hypothetical protein EJ06DRAFT_499774 [Trichodelitschia bisporula]